ncbi:MAG: beta-glucosidase BglX [Cytophagales bacterium]|nr:beta-glucosidase BglX [Cytophagales bacterium]
MEEKIEELLGKMTLEEKVGQMNQYNGFWDVTGPPPKGGDPKVKYEHLQKGWVGSVLNVVGHENVREFQKMAVEGSRLGIPLLFGMDVIHGHKTLTPIPLAEAASWDLQAIEKSARVAAIEASARGINWTFAPMVDISRDARWGRVMEGAGEDPYLGALVGAARVRGFQGNDLAAEDTIAACAKHFAGYGFAEAGRDYNTVDIGASTLYNIVFPPFKSAIDRGVKTVMNAFNLLDGVPATGNEFLQRDILKGKWGFQGLIVSDWASVAEMTVHGFAKDLKNAAELAINAGSDMDMESYAYITYLCELVREGKVTENTIDDAVRRILRVKYELGLFDDPYRYCNAGREEKLIYHPDHKEVALDIAKKSIVLLKNKNHLLPLDKNQPKIGVIGPLAEDKNSPLGSWRLGSDDNTAVSLLEGLKEYTHEIRYAKGADLVVGKASFIEEVEVNTTGESGFKEAIELAKASEVVIMVLGEHGFQSGEGRSRTRLGLPGVQQALLEEVYQVNQNIILVLMNGRPLTLTWADEHIPAILETWHLGTQSGHAIAQVLFGDHTPGGKLPMTFPRDVGQVPIYYNHYNTGRPTPEQEVFWSHYIDESNQPLYPFGYGLSYTTFAYSDLTIDDTEDTLVVSVWVTNTGVRAGEEVAQLYIRDRVASIARPVKELKGFHKFMLMPGESKKVEFSLGRDELGFYNLQGDYIVEPGLFDVWIGTNSQEGLQGSFELKEEWVKKMWSK